MKTSPISHLTVERYVAGELEAVDQQMFQERLKVDIDLQQRVSEIEIDSALFSRRHPFESSKASRVRTASHSAPVRASRRPVWITASVFTSLLVLVVSVSIFQTLAPPATTELSPVTEETIYLKGVQPRLRIFKRLTTGSEELVDGAFVAQNETLQLRYMAGGFQYGVIVSIDGRGSVNLHFPATAQSSTKLSQGGELALPYAYQLDDAPKFEEFVFVLSNKLLRAGDVLEGISKQAEKIQKSEDKIKDKNMKLTLPDGVEIVSMTLKKGNV